jgi:hypothetical protein
VQRGFTSIQAWCERWNIKISEDKTQAICFSHRGGPIETHLTLKGGNIPFVKDVEYLDIIFDKKNTWKIYMYSIATKALRTFIRMYPFLKGERLSVTPKLTIYKESLGP